MPLHGSVPKIRLIARSQFPRLAASLASNFRCSESLVPIKALSSPSSCLRLVTWMEIVEFQGSCQTDELTFSFRNSDFNEAWDRDRNKFLVTGGSDSILSLYDLSLGHQFLLNESRGPSRNVIGEELNQVENEFVKSPKMRCVEPIETSSPISHSLISCFKIEPGTARLCVACLDGTVVRFAGLGDIGGSPVNRVRLDPAVKQIANREDDPNTLLCTSGSRVVIIDWRVGRPVSEACSWTGVYQGPTVLEISCLVNIPNGGSNSVLVSTGGSDGKIRIWDLRKSGARTCLEETDTSKGYVRSIDISDGILISRHGSSGEKTQTYQIDDVMKLRSIQSKEPAKMKSQKNRVRHVSESFVGTAKWSKGLPLQNGIVRVSNLTTAKRFNWRHTSNLYMGGAPNGVDVNVTELPNHDSVCNLSFSNELVTAMSDSESHSLIAKRGYFQTPARVVCKSDMLAINSTSLSEEAYVWDLSAAPIDSRRELSPSSSRWGQMNEGTQQTPPDLFIVNKSAALLPEVHIRAIREQ